MNNLEETDRKDLKLRRKGEARYLKGYKKKLQKGICLNNTKKKYSFPQRSIDTWNGLKEQVIMAKNVHQLKEKLVKYGYGDRTIRVYTTTRSIHTNRKVGRHTHAKGRISGL